MKIFVAHSSNFDFKNDLYLPLRNSQLNNEHEIFLPQEKNNLGPVTKDIIRNSDLIIADITFPSTGQGIELGWADIFHVPIICIYKNGSKISRSLNKLTDKFIIYDDAEDMIQKIIDFLKND
jgi:hypothetical protein